MSVREYLKNCNEVYHTTFDPNGPGCVRIHLIPPKKVKLGIPWVVILNGYYILPLQTAWAIILKEFIEHLNKIGEHEIDKDEAKELVSAVTKRCVNVFKTALATDVEKDLEEIIETLVKVARCQEVDEEIGLLSLKEYHKFMASPHRMDLLVSSMSKNGKFNCNQKCLHCYAGKEKMAQVEELCTDDWKRVIDKCKEAYIPCLTFTGGEPTLRDDLVELIDYAKWFVTRLNTNGILLSDELCKKLYRASLDSVQVTFYSSDQNVHNTLVGGNHFTETIMGIKNALANNLDVSCNTPLCNLNSNYVETIKFLSGLGVKYFSCSGLIPSGEALTSESRITALSVDEITEVVKDAFEYCKANGLELSFTSPGWIEDSVLQKIKMVVPSCGACLSNMAVAPNGEVIPCQSWLFEEGFGNILELPWKKIWNSRMCKLRRKFSSTAKSCPLHEVKR